MARIALDARPLTKTQGTGVENIGRLYLNALFDVPRRHEWIFYFLDPPAFPPPFRWRAKRVPGWLRVLVPFWLWCDRVHLIHFYLSYVPPLIRALPTRAVVTVCDVMWLDDLNFIDPPSRKFIIKGVLPSLRKRTDHFIAISEATRGDLIKRLGIPKDRISVVYPYPHPLFRPCPDAREAVRRIYGIDKNFFLFVGTAKPNKNIGRLLDAFQRVRAKHRDAQLVVAGFVLPFWDETRRLLRMGKGVLWIRFVPEEHLPLLYSACVALLSPSLNEGFGLPLLEAMACGAPVLAGDTGAQPEVVGDAGFLVNPYDTGAITEAMESLWVEESLRRKLAQKSLERARTFTCRRTLQSLLSAYEQALALRP